MHGPFVGFGSTSALLPLAGIRQISTSHTERKKSYKVERGRWPFWLCYSWRGKRGEANFNEGPLARYYLAFFLRLRGNKTPLTCGVQALLSGLHIFCAIAHFLNSTSYYVPEAQFMVV